MHREVYRAVRPTPTARRAGATLLAALLALAAAAWPARALSTEGLLWQVDGDGGRAYLLGSLHFGSEDLYPLSARIERAYAASDRLLVEVNLLDLSMAQAGGLVRSLGAYRGADGLRDHLPEDTWQRLFRAARSLGVTVSVFEEQRPWLASLTLTALALQGMGLSAEQGIDRHFMQRARRAGVEIVEMESFEEQLKLLGGFAHAEQVRMLEQALSQVEQGRSLAVELLRAWRTGDEAALERMLVASLGEGAAGRELSRRLLDERNVRMAARVEEQIARGGVSFVVVGAAHLLGERSIAAELSRRGLRLARR